MDLSKIRRSRQTGGAVLKALVAFLLLGLAFGVYQANSFYQAKIAPVVESVSKVAAVAAGVTKAAASLNPYKITREPAEIAQKLSDSFRIAVPTGYVGAFGMDVALLGQKQSQVLALIPSTARPSDIFEGGRNEIRFNPGRNTIFLAATFNRAERDEMRDAMSRLAGSDAQSEPLQSIYIDAGGRKVAALRGNTQSYGVTNTVVFTFLDDGRRFFAVGPRDSFDEAALRGALTSLVASHPANVLFYEHPKPEVDTPPSSDPCGIPRLKTDFEVHVVSVTRGSTPLDIAIDQSGSDVFQEDVVVGATSKPVVLLLMGQSPIVWKVGQASGARIAGVLAQGNLRQAVIGLPKSVLLTTYASADGPNACRSFGPQHAEAVDLPLKNRVRELFGRGIAGFHSKKASGPFLIGDVNGETAYSMDRTIESVALPDNVLPGGQKGLDRLVKQHVIRLATEKELTDWLGGAARKTGKIPSNFRGTVRWEMIYDSVYVVLKDVELPDELYGANARTFIIPPGVHDPGGPKGHNTFLRMEDFQCYGVGCT